MGDSSPPQASKELSQFEKVVELLTTMFPVWVCSLSHMLNQLLCHLEVSMFHFEGKGKSKLSVLVQVILGTLIGIYKPSAVIITHHTHKC